MNRLKLLFGLAILFVLIGGSFVKAYGFELYTDAQVYSKGQPLLVYGKALPSEPIIIRLFAPDGTIKQFNQIAADSNGDFNQILIRWPNATTNYAYGTYSVEGIATKEQGLSIRADVKFAPSSSIISVPIQRNLITTVYAPQTAAVNQTFRVFVQVTSDGLLVAGDPSKILATSHVHLPSGDVIDLTNSFQTLHTGLFYTDFTPMQEGTYVFHIIAFNQGTVSQGSTATQVLKQSIEGISNQIIKLNTVLDTTSDELSKLKTEIQGFGNVLNTSQNSITQANENMNKSVSSMSDSVKNLEAASGQFNSLFLPVVALIAVIIALQITILARRR
jgi:hypothetical protein